MDKRIREILDKEKNRELIIDLYSLERRQKLIIQYFSDWD